MAVESFVSLPWGKLACQSWGDPGLPRVLAMHGWLDNSQSFATLAPLLAHSHHLVAPDFAGHGYSSHRPEGVAYPFVDHVTDMVQLLDALGWEKCDLLGHSMGGGVATLLAAGLPERFGKLILLESLGPLTEEADAVVARFRYYLQSALSLPKKKRAFYPDVETAIRIRRKVGEMTEASARLLVERNLQREGNGFTWRSDRRLTLPTHQRATEAQVSALVAAITAPVLLVRGTRDSVLRQETWERRIPHVRDLQQQVVDGAHHLHLDNPQPVAQFIGDFLKRR